MSLETRTQNNKKRDTFEDRNNEVNTPNQKKRRMSTCENKILIKIEKNNENIRLNNYSNNSNSMPQSVLFIYI